MKTYRDNGAIGALLDEYEKVIDELKQVISSVTDEQLVKILDSETKAEDCRSIQTVLTHVLRAAYCYVICIRNSLGESLPFPERIKLESAQAYMNELDQALAYNVLLFKDFPNIGLEENDPSKKILTNWGQRYDVEQLMEHAIVHVMRHRRQIERFLLL